MATGGTKTRSSSLIHRGTIILSARTNVCLVSNYGQTAYVWDSDTGELLFAVSGGGTMEDADFTPDGSALLTGNASGAATLWQTAAE